MNTSVQVARRGRRRSSAVSHNPRLSSVSNFWSREYSIIWWNSKCAACFWQREFQWWLIQSTVKIGQNSYSTFATPSVGSLFDEVALNEEVARQERKFISSQKANARKRKKGTHCFLEKQNFCIKHLKPIFPFCFDSVLTSRTCPTRRTGGKDVQPHWCGW